MRALALKKKNIRSFPREGSFFLGILSKISGDCIIKPNKSYFFDYPPDSFRCLRCLPSKLIQKNLLIRQALLFGLILYYKRRQP